MTAGPLDQRGDADGEERARGAHHQDVSGADAPDAGGLEDGGGPTDEQRGEDAPGKVGFGLIGDAENDRHAQHDPPDDDGGGLDAGADGQQVGGMLVRLVADVFVKLCGGQEILSEYKCDVIAVSIGIVCNGRYFTVCGWEYLIATVNHATSLGAGYSACERVLCRARWLESAAALCRFVCAARSARIQWRCEMARGMFASAYCRDTQPAIRRKGSGFMPS